MARLVTLLIVIAVLAVANDAQASLQAIGEIPVSGRGFMADIALHPMLTRPAPLLERLLNDTDWENPTSETDKVMAEFVMELLRDERQSKADRKSVFAWHRFASRFNFVLAHLFVLWGIVVSSREFLQAREMRAKGLQAPDVAVKLGYDGVAFRTSLIGTLILLLSLGFYYMFLAFVYPIQMI